MSSNRVWIVVILVSSVLSPARPGVVNVGALVCFNSMIGKVARVAIEAAVHDVNSDPSILNGTELKIAIQDTKTSDFLGIMEALSFMENDTVAIIGPQFSVTAHVISHIANELQVPLLSFAATDSTLSSLQFPYFVRTTQSDAFQMHVVAQLVSYYEWRDVVAIYVDDDFGRNGIVDLGDKLAETRCRISYKAALSPRAGKDEITAMLIKVSLLESRILIIHIYTSWGLDVLEQAKNMQMMEAGYVWIATDWLSTVLDTEPSLFFTKTDVIQGVLTLRMYTPESKLKSSFISRWGSLTRSVPTPGNESFGLNVYGLYAYDSVWILAAAIDSFLAQEGNFTFSDDPSLAKFHGGGDRMNLKALSISDGGKLLLKNIASVNRVGVTGPLMFDSTMNLVGPAYEVINVIGMGIRRVGYWLNSSGLSIQSPEQVQGSQVDKRNTSSAPSRIYSVIWPGQTTTKPRGWVFPNHGKKLRIGVPNCVSSLEFVSCSSEGSEAFSGYCIDVFTSALEELEYAVPFKFIPYGDGHTNPSTIDLLRMITKGAFDAVVGDITITTSRTKIVDFTQPYIESGLVVVAPIRKMNSSAWAFLRPFTPMMWCVTGAFFLVVGVVVWILERRTNEDFSGPLRKQVVTIMWFSFSTLFFSHKERTGSTLARFVLIIWLFVVLVLNSSYIASLTSILTVEQLSSSVKGIESLTTSKDPIGFPKGSFVESYLTEELSIQRARLVPLNTHEDYEKALKAGPSNKGVAAVILSRFHLRGGRSCYRRAVQETTNRRDFKHDYS